MRNKKRKLADELRTVEGKFSYVSTFIMNIIGQLSTMMEMKLSKKMVEINYLY